MPPDLMAGGAGREGRQLQSAPGGLEALPEICSKLVAHGLAATHPVALVQDGTTPRQRVLVSTLGQMPDAARDAGFKSPSLIIVGEVVTLHERLNWYLGTQDLRA